MFDFILDIIFPIKCLGSCGRYDTWLCDECSKMINEKHKFLIPKKNLRGLYYLAGYQNKLIQKLIHQMKYQYAEKIASILGKRLAGLLDQEFDYIIPVPLHKKRYAERGFNQAELLARCIVETCHGMSLQNNILIREKNTQAQAQLPHEQRKENLTNAFSINKSKTMLIKGKKILLIDDVFTTGTTMQECANLLKLYGASEIWGIAIAKG